jgi:hypothetical protein
MQFTEVEADGTPVTVNGTKTIIKPKQKQRRNLPALPTNPGASAMADVLYSCKVDNSPASWEALPLYSPFSLSADGSYPMVKVSCSKAADLRTGKSIPVGSGRCYRVVF